MIIIIITICFVFLFFIIIIISIIIIIIVIIIIINHGYYYYHYYYYYCIDRSIYLNLSKSTQSAAWLKALKPAANGRYFMCKPLPYYFHFTVQRYIYPPVSKVHAGFFSRFRNPPDSDMEYRIFNVRM